MTWEYMAGCLMRARKLAKKMEANAHSSEPPSISLFLILFSTNCSFKVCHFLKKFKGEGGEKD